MEIEFGGIKIQRWCWRDCQLSSSQVFVPVGHAPVQCSWHAAQPNVALHHPAVPQQCEPHLHLPIGNIIINSQHNEFTLILQQGHTKIDLDPVGLSKISL